MTTRDQNGRVLHLNVRREADGTWGANVWWGGAWGFATDAKRYFYKTRDAARAANIADETWVRSGGYEG